MTVYNWIQARFADGPNFVSDAPDEVSREVAGLFAELPAAVGCEVGVLSLGSGAQEWSCSYLRFAEAGGAPGYVHAVLATPGACEPSVAKLQGLFEGRYGRPTEARVRELVARLALLPIAQATLALADLFVDAAALEPLLREPAERRPRALLERANQTLPWLLATAAASVAGFNAARGPVASLPPVDASPPSLEFEQRLERLERLDGEAGVSLRAQLAHARQLHELALAEKNQQIEALSLRLDAALTSTEVALETSTEPLPAQTPAESATPSHATVATDVLWVRGGPGVEHRKVTRLRRDDVVGLAGPVESGWVRLTGLGFAAAHYLEFPQ